MIVRSVPLIWTVVFYGVGFFGRAWLQRRRFGHSGLMLFRSGRWMQHMREAGLLVLSTALFLQAAIYAVHPERLTSLLLFDPPQAGSPFVLGAALLFGATVFMVVAQLDLGASWRVGFDED